MVGVSAWDHWVPSHTYALMSMQDRSERHKALILVYLDGCISVA